jgi:hypothetical protein
MGNFGLLGKMAVTVLNWTSCTHKSSVTFAEHGRIKGKPLLEPIADNLDELSVELGWHAMTGQPGPALAQLAAMLEEKLPFAVVIANAFIGVYVLTEINRVPPRHMGNLLMTAGCTLALREFAGPLADADLGPPSALALAKNGVPLAAVTGATGAIKVAQGLPAMPNMPNVAGVAKLAEQAQSLGAQVRGALGVAQAGLGVMQALQGNPLAAIGLLPGVLGNLAQSLPAANGLRTTLTELSPVLNMGAQWVDAATTIGKQVTSARKILSSANGGNLIQQLSGATGALKQASGALDTLALPFSEMTLARVMRFGV